MPGATSKKIIPHFWFDTEAKEAAAFYVSLFPDSSITNVTTIHGVPSPTGNSDIISFELSNQSFMAINAGPLFKPNPSISFFINCQTAEEVDRFWGPLSDGGLALMPLDAYPFSERYGWVQDRYGISWQVNLAQLRPKEKIMPSLLFTGDNYGRAEEAIDFYVSVFNNASKGSVVHYGPEQEQEREDAVAFADFTLEGKLFAAMDSGLEHGFTFNEAISLLVACDSQEEIDYYWEKLSVVPEAEQCGWLKDRYGVSWQIAPARMNEMMAEGTPEQLDRVTRAFLPMKKFDLAALEAAYQGR